jgi:hypothetical protein
MILDLSDSKKSSISKAYIAFLPRRIPALPGGNLGFPYHRHLKSSSPQIPAQDKRIISAIFAESVIREGFGKLAAA